MSTCKISFLNDYKGKYIGLGNSSRHFEGKLIEIGSKSLILSVENVHCCHPDTGESNFRNSIYFIDLENINYINVGVE